MALVPCDHCDGEHAAGTARCPMTGALLRRPRVVAPPPDPQTAPEPDPAVAVAPAGGPDPHAAFLGAPSPSPSTAAVDAAGPTALRVLPDGPVVHLAPGHVVPLGRESSPIAHVCPDNISRRHAEVRVEPDRTVVVDVGSANGTFVNDRPLPPGHPHPLVPGDTIRLGGDPALRISFTTP